MNGISIEVWQSLQDIVDAKAKAEAERFQSGFIVGSGLYNEDLVYVAMNKIDTDLVCRGELPICQSPRDLLAVCEAKDFLEKKLMSSEVVCTGLGVNCYDCNESVLQKELNIDFDKAGGPIIPINPVKVTPIAHCAVIGSGSAFYIPAPEQDEYFLSQICWVFDNPIALANPEAIHDLLNQLNTYDIPTSKVFLTLCSDDGSDFVVFPPDYQRWFEETYACFG